MNRTLNLFGWFFVFTLAITIFSLALFTFSNTQVYAEGSFVFTSHLELGVVSNDVKELQILLNSKGYDVGIPDGKFGPSTKAQVILFQKDNGLTPDGIIGQGVRAFLNGTSTIFPISSAPRTLKLTIPRIKGDDVKALQIFLNNSGYNTGTPDGSFGPKTEVQVKLFQIANNLIPDGKVGKITRNLINTTSVSNPQGTLSISGCSGKIGYSTTTGVSCSTVFLPIGCNSSSIYSTSTGLSCATGLPPTSTFKIVQFVNNIKRNTIINTPTITGVTVPVTNGIPTATITITDQYTATISWTGSPSVFLASTSYISTITLTPKTGYTLTGVTANFFTVAGATSTNLVDSGVITAVFPATQAYATVPSSIVLAVGSTAPVGGVTNVAIPATGGTDTTGVITGYVAISADKIKFTVVDGGSATSTITINGGAYTSGADYQVPSLSPLTIVVTTTEANKVTVTRTFTVSIFVTDSLGNIYGTVTGADGRIWLDRNLGATQVATSATDYLAYGSLFQWGRGADGHNLINHTSATAATAVNGSTTTLSVTDTPGNNLFIKPTSPYDWRSTKNDNLWQGVNSTNNVCPAGFRLPTNTEQGALVTAAGITNMATAYSSSLKLTAAGYRYDSDASLRYLGVYGYYWSSSVSGTFVLTLAFNASSADPASVDNRAYGFSVRCLKD